LSLKEDIGDLIKKKKKLTVLIWSLGTLI